MQFIGLSIGGMIGQAFAIAHGRRLISAMLCDTSPQTPPGAQGAWAPRIEAVKKANSLAPLADPTMERWFTDAYKPRNPGRWKQIQATIAGTTPAGYLGCAAAILNFDFTPKLPSLKVPTLVVCGDKDEGTPPAGNKKIAELDPRRPLRGDRRRPPLPQRRARRGLQQDHAPLARLPPLKRWGSPAECRAGDPTLLAPARRCQSAPASRLRMNTVVLPGIIVPLRNSRYPRLA